MSIEWDLIQKNPSKNHKIYGQALLELRNRYLSMEQKLSEAMEELLSLKATSSNIKEKYDNRDNDILKLMESMKNLNIEYSKSITENLQKENELKGFREEELKSNDKIRNNDYEIEKLNFEISKLSPLKEKISNTNSIILQKENELKESKEKEKALENKFKIAKNLNENIKLKIRKYRKIIELKLNYRLNKIKNLRNKLNDYKLNLNDDISKQQIISNKLSSINEDITYNNQEKHYSMEKEEFGKHDINKVHLNNSKEKTNNLPVRIECPMCNSTGKDIPISSDKSKILRYDAGFPIYKKRRVCRKCGYQF